MAIKRRKNHISQSLIFYPKHLSLNWREIGKNGEKRKNNYIKILKCPHYLKASIY